MSREISSDEAVALLRNNGVDVHNISVGGMMMGATWSRERAIETIRAASKIAIEDFRNHRLVVTEASGRVSLFETDDDVVDAFLKERAA
jgi:hypothetical protein